MMNKDLSGLLKYRKWITVAHHIPGRIRLRFTNNLIVTLGRHKLSMLDKFCDENGALKSYCFNLNTASLILEYNANLLSPPLINQLFDDDEQKAVEALVKLVPVIIPNLSE